MLASKRPVIVAVCLCSYIFLMQTTPLQATRGFLQTLTTKDGLPSSCALAFAETPNGNIWVATGAGLSEFDGKWISHHERGGPGAKVVFAMDVDGAGNVWAGNADGVFRWDGSHWRHYPDVKMGRPRFRITDALACDRHGVVWVGAQDQRIYRLHENQWDSFGPEDGLPEDCIMTLACGQDRNTWAGFYDGTIARYDGHRWQTWSEQERPWKAFVRTIEFDSRGNVWVGTWAGLFRYDGKDWEQFEPNLPDVSDCVHSLAVDSYDRVWYGSYGRGAFCFDGQEWYHLHSGNFALPDNYIQSMFADSRGTIWMGGVGGAMHRLSRSWRAAKFGTETAAKGSAAVCRVACCPDGELWLATRFAWTNAGTGLRRVLPGGRTERVTARKAIHLFTDEVRDVEVAPDGTVWLATACGLIKYGSGEFVPCSFDFDGPLSRPEWCHYRADPNDQGREQRWYTPTYDASGWKKLGYWAETTDKIGWVRTEVMIPEKYQGWDLLYLAEFIKDRDEFYFNGVHVGSCNTSRQADRLYIIPKELVNPGKENTVCLRISQIYGSLGINGAKLWPIRRRQDSLDLVELDVDTEGIVWVLDRQGKVARFDGQIWKDITVIDPNSVWLPGKSPYFWRVGLYHDVDGLLWIGGSGGLFVVATKPRAEARAVQFQESISQIPYFDRVTAISDDGKGRLWVASEARLGGLTGTAWEFVDWPFDGQTARPSCIVVDGQGIVWVGTSNAGLHAFDGSSWSSFSVADGLESSTVVDLATDGRKYLWAACGIGGLATYQFDVAAPQVELISPATIVSHPGQVQYAWKGWDRWGQTSTADLRYIWRLDQGAWSAPTYETQVFFPRMEPGSHEFEVKALDKNLNKTVETCSVAFSVVGPVWQQAWFLFLMGGTTIALALSILFAWTRHLRLGVAYRNIASGKEKLEGANKRLQELDALKTEFLSNVSHELRTPLTSIKGSVDNLLDGIAGEMSPPQREYLALISDSTNRLIPFVNELLDLARIEEGKVDLVFEPIRLDVLLDRTIKSLQPFASERGLALDITEKTSRVTVRADADRIAQVITNLVGNALKFTPSGGAVSVVLEQDGRNQARVSIVDTGPGIPADELDHIFDKFHQVKAQMPANQQGAGLGLSIAKGIVQAHGGTIGVSSKVGHGSTFWFALPVVVDEGLT
jgi:signal transduction histidine kinase/ligand-binding sensor domain-containing protein